MGATIASRLTVLTSASSISSFFKQATDLADDLASVGASKLLLHPEPFGHNGLLVKETVDLILSQVEGRSVVMSGCSSERGSSELSPDFSPGVFRVARRRLRPISGSQHD